MVPTQLPPATALPAAPPAHSKETQPTQQQKQNEQPKPLRAADVREGSAETCWVATAVAAAATTAPAPAVAAAAAVVAVRPPLRGQWSTGRELPS